MMHPAAKWREMESADLEKVNHISNQIHTLYFEGLKIFEERLKLYPAGCSVLEVCGTIAGYAISHPWTLFCPPKINTFLGKIPYNADTYYIHDIAIMPNYRQYGMASKKVSDILCEARRLGCCNSSLISVNRTTLFWQKFGFQICIDKNVYDLTQSYGTDAKYMVKYF